MFSFYPYHDACNTPFASFHPIVLNCILSLSLNHCPFFHGHFRIKLHSSTFPYSFIRSEIERATRSLMYYLDYVTTVQFLIILMAIPISETQLASSSISECSVSSTPLRKLSKIHDNPRISVSYHQFRAIVHRVDWRTWCHQPAGR
jgi:hypothetical protein